MKTFLFHVCLILSLSCTLVCAQTTDPVKIREYETRFKKGIALENEGRLKEAREIFEGIVKDEPKAKGSLFYIGFISLRLGEPAKAIDALEKFRVLAPQDFRGLVLLIQANQTLRRTPKVQILRQELFKLRQDNFISGLSDAKSYRRERVPLPKDMLLVVEEYFEPAKNPYFVWEGIVRDSNDKITRHLALSYDPEQTRALREKDPKYATSEMYFFVEYVIKNGLPQQINIYRQEFVKPGYDDFRGWLLAAIEHPPEPLMTAPYKEPAADPKAK